MNAKISIIAGAVVLALAGNANAAVISNQANWSTDQLVLSVYDQVTQTSYTRGLGENIGQLMSGAGLTFGGTAKAPVITGSDTVANNYSLAADANLQSFLSANKADLGTIQWSVIGGGAPTNTYGKTGYVSTSNTMVTGWNSSRMSGMNGFNGNYLLGAGTSVNSLMPTGSVMGNTDSITASVGQTGYTYQAGNGMYNNFGNQAPFTDNASLGQAQDFYIMTPGQTSRGSLGPVAMFQFGNANGMSTFNLSSTGNLSYSVATPTAAVPEPGEWAMLVSGLAMLGFIGMRRSKKA